MDERSLICLILGAIFSVGGTVWYGRSAGRKRTFAFWIAVTGVILVGSHHYVRRVEIPMVDFDLSSEITDHLGLEAFEVDGIQWKEGWRKYYVYLRNESATASISGVVIEIVVPGRVVDRTIELTRGVEGAVVSSGLERGAYRMHFFTPIIEGDRWRKSRSASNYVRVDAITVAPQGRVTAGFIVEPHEMGGTEGSFEINYRYEGFASRVVIVQQLYKLSSPRTGSSLVLDRSRPIDERPEIRVFNIDFPDGGIGIIERDRSDF